MRYTGRMECRQEGYKVDRKEEKKRGRQEGKVVSGRGRLVGVGREVVKKEDGQEIRQEGKQNGRQDALKIDRKAER